MKKILKNLTENEIKKIYLIILFGVYRSCLIFHLIKYKIQPIKWVVNHFFRFFTNKKKFKKYKNIIYKCIPLNQKAKVKRK